MRLSLGARHQVVRQFGVPSGWRAVQLGSLAKVVGGGTPSREEGTFWSGGKIPWATPTDLTATPGKYIRRTAERITQAGLAESGAVLLPINTVLFTSRATIGESAIAKCEMTTNQGFANFIPFANTNSGFLYYLLHHLTPVIKRLSAGTTFNEISKRELREVWCAVPDALEEQAAIARILDAVDTAIERTQQVVEALVDFEYSLLHELLGQDQDLPATKVGRAVKASKRQRVDEVAEVGSGVTLGKDVSGVRYAELPYLRVANVQDGHLDLGTIKSVRVPVRDVDRYRLQVGDVLMTEGGDIDKLGRGTIWHGQIENCLHQNHIFRVRADRDKLEPRYFAWVVQSNIAKAYFLRVAKRTTNLASINKTQLRAFRFPVPELEDQHFIADTMEAARATTEGHNAKMGALVDLKRSLLHDLLTGKVRTDQLALDEVAA